MYWKAERGRHQLVWTGIIVVTLVTLVHNRNKLHAADLDGWTLNIITI